MHAVWSAIGMILSSVCLSVCLSVTLCIVAKRYILQQKCLNKWIGSATRNTILKLSTPYTDPTPSSSSLEPRILAPSSEYIKNIHCTGPTIYTMTHRCISLHNSLNRDGCIRVVFILSYRMWTEYRYIRVESHHFRRRARWWLCTPSVQRLLGSHFWWSAVPRGQYWPAQGPAPGCFQGGLPGSRQSVRCRRISRRMSVGGRRWHCRLSGPWHLWWKTEQQDSFSPAAPLHT